MGMLKSKLLNKISIVLTVCIILVVIIIFIRYSKKITVKYFVPGNLSNMGCLSVYVDDPKEGNEYSFDSGQTWQKSNYGAVYGKTNVLVRNEKQEVIYQEEIKSDGFISDAPYIKINFDETIKKVTSGEILKNVKATYNGKDISSNIKANILEQSNKEILVSYLIHDDIKRCYLLRNISIVTDDKKNNDNSDNINTIISSTNNDRWVWPTNKPYSISSYYGWRNKKFHNGVDIYGPKRGSSIYAARDGIVTDINSNSSSGYYVIIKHDNGYYTRYAHMQNTRGNDKLKLTSSATKYITVGQIVRAHDVIGEIGSSGNSTGVHLHFEIWNGKPFVSKSFNPLSFYKK